MPWLSCSEMDKTDLFNMAPSTLFPRIVLKDGCVLRGKEVQDTKWK
jgi:hypothetical protein